MNGNIKKLVKKAIRLYALESKISVDEVKISNIELNVLSIIISGETGIAVYYKNFLKMVK